MTRAWNEAILTSKGQKARIEADEVALMLGNRSREIVEPEFMRDAGHRLEGVHVTADEGFETLAVRELQIHLAAVALDQAKA